MPTEFNENIFDRYIDSNNFNGAAMYLEQFKATTPAKYIEQQEQIRQLKRKGAIQDAFLNDEKTSEEERHAYYYYQAMLSNGTVPHQEVDEQGNISGEYNKFGDKYLELINQQTANPNGIKNVLFQFKSEDEINKFVQTLGYKDYHDYNSKGDGFISYKDTNSSTLTLEVPLNAGEFPKIYEANTAGFWSKLLMGERFSNPIEVETNKGQKVKVNNVNIPSNHSSSGYYHQQSNDNFEVLDDINKIYQDAKKSYNDLIERNKNSKTTDRMIVGSGIGLADMELLDYYKRGVIGPDEYQKHYKILQDKYEKIINQHDFKARELYVQELKDGKSTQLTAVNDEEKNDYTRRILAAVHDKRATYTSALIGADYGTLITISDETDNNGKFKGEKTSGVRIFVPGLFKESAQQQLNRDTKTIASRDFHDMKRWNYSTTLENGNTIGFYNHKPYILDSNGNYLNTGNEEYDSKYILDKLHEKVIFDQTIKVLCSNLNDDWSPMTSVNKKGEEIPIDIYEKAKTICNVAITDLYPNASKEQKVQYANDMLNHILDVLNWNPVTNSKRQ